MTAVISSQPNFKKGESPILVLFFLFLCNSSHLNLASFSNSSTQVSLFSYILINPHTSALFITSNSPSLPKQMNLSPFCNSIWWISGSLIIPIFFANRSPNDLVKANPGPSSSIQHLYGPTGNPSYITFSILPPNLNILSFSSGLFGLWSYVISMAMLSLLFFR